MFFHKTINKEEINVFDFGLIDNILTIALIINLINDNFEGLISLNSIGTNPLEHHFGLFRIWSKYQHSFDIKIQKENLLKMAFIKRESRIILGHLIFLIL